MLTLFRFVFGLVFFALVIVFGWTFKSQPASALPSYARQTGQPCAACHMGFPELTPTGRAFKLNGYVWPGGDSKLPPVAVMLQPAFTHTSSGQAGGAAPHFGANDNFTLQQASLFYGGAIDADLGLGAFAQFTYDSASRRFGWDNTDIRLARTGTLGDKTFIYGLTLTTNGTDNLTDIGLDVQYQFIGERDGITLQASWINESQGWDASLPLGFTANGHDTLRSFNAKASYLYKQTVGASLGYFNIGGTTDPGLYGAGAIGGSANGSPDSAGWTAEIDYMPFNNGGPSFWPWLNAKFGLQYVAYAKFNGGTTNYDGFGRNASANNTLFLYTWMAF